MYKFGPNSRVEAVLNAEKLPNAVPAQNNTNPLAIFNNHALVYINGILYDPSYGVTYSGADSNVDGAVRDFQDRAISFYGYYYAKSNQYFLRPIGNSIDLKFIRLRY